MKLKSWPLVYIPVEEVSVGRRLDERVARIEAIRGTPEDASALEEADFET